MRKNFWENLTQPFFCLAPMEEVTDVAFREMFARHSNQQATNSRQLNNFVMFTEFVNVDGLLHPEGFKKLSIDLKFTENQRPIVAQIWGTNPEKFKKAAELVASMGFDGIDINMGCPQDKEIGIGACAALIRTPELAGQIIQATIEGAGGLPVSVKTRIGYSKATEMEDWIRFLLKFEISALTIHARTKQEKSKVPARWEKIKEAVEIRNEIQSAVVNKTIIIGNGDVRSMEEGMLRVKETGCEGVMIARGAFGNPWLFKKDTTAQEFRSYVPTMKEKLAAMLEHLDIFEKWLPDKSFFIMRKHFKAYASGFENSAELRVKLMEAKDSSEAKKIVNQLIS